MQKQYRSVVATLTTVALLTATAQPVLSQGEDEPAAMPAGRSLYPEMAPPFETIVADGAPKATIVTSAEPSAVELLAAQELQLYLERMSGAVVPIVARTARPSGFALLLGPEHVESKRALRDLPRPLGEEGVRILKVPGALVLTGEQELGTLWAVYSFLEKYLGVRWFQEHRYGEVALRRETIVVGQIDEAKTPAFPMRWVGWSHWSRRNKCNAALHIGGKRVGFNVWGGYHTFSSLLSSRDYFGAHPEWFPLIDGERRQRNPRIALPRGYYKGHQICTSAPAVAKQVVRNMRRLLENDPSLRVLGLGPNDGMGYCACPGCRALDEDDVQSDQRMSRRLLVFYNQVARRLEATHPHVIVKGGAYHIYTRPPKDRTLTAEDNLGIQICHYSQYCLNHSVFDSACQRNARFLDLLNGWARLTKHIYFYEYYWKCNWCEMPWPIVHSIRRDIPQFKAMGVVDGLYTQYTAANTSTIGLNYYVAAKLLWDPGLDVDRLLADFYEKYYAEAARPMRRYHEAWETALQKSGKCISGGGMNALGIYKTAHLDQCERQLTEALTLANDDTVNARIRLHVRSLDYVRRYVAFGEAFNAAHDPESTRRALTLGQDLVAWLRTNQPELSKGILNQNSELIQYYLGGRIEGLMRRNARGVIARAATLPEWAELPRDWRFATDPKGTGLTRGFHAPDCDDRAWRTLLLSRPWHCQGVKYEGHAWLRGRFRAPADAPDANPVLVVAGVNGVVSAWLNGRQIVENADGSELIKAPLGDAVKLNEENLLALRIDGRHGVCGVFGKVKVATDQALNAVWMPGSSFVRSYVPEGADGKHRWRVLGPGATISAAYPKAGYDGSWVEYDVYAPRTAEYRIWLRLAQYQDHETKTLHIDGREVGAIKNRRSTKSGELLFLSLPTSIQLREGDHKLRIVASHVYGWVDPINWIYLTPEHKLDPQTVQEDNRIVSWPMCPEGKP